MPPYDLVLRGGTIATAAGRFEADLAVAGGRIAQVGGAMGGRREIDARGKLVLPGGVDPHVHLSHPEPPGDGPAWCDDFSSGTRAAAAGGITTVGNMTFPWPGQSLRQALDRDAAAVRQEAIVDVLLHPVLTDPTEQHPTELADLAAAGQPTWKFFTSFGGFVADPAPYLAAMRLAAAHGLLTLVHCEDAAILAAALDHLRATGRTGVEHYPRSRPTTAETAATARIAAFAEETGAPTYVVHLSSAAALAEVGRGRARGASLFVETRPLYLFLTEERFAEVDGAKYAGQPPLRTAGDVEALWRGLAAGEIDTIGSDHAPWRYADKVFPGVEVAAVRPGVADLEVMLPLLFSGGVVRGRLSLERFVELTATTPARLLGLAPRKGTIAPGADADLAVWDPTLTKPVRAAEFASNGDFSPYEGWPVTGWPEVTISRGEVVFADGQIVGAQGRGHVPRRGRTTAP